MDAGYFNADMRIFAFLLVIGFVSSVAAIVEYVEFRSLVEFLERTKGEKGPNRCGRIIEEMNDNLSGFELPVPDTPEFFQTLHHYLMMGKESSIYAQKLEYIRIFTTCLILAGFETLPFEYYAQMILTEPAKRLDEMDLLTSQAISSLVASRETEPFVPKYILDQAFENQRWSSMDRNCRSFANDVKSRLSGDPVTILSERDVVKTLIKAKDTAIHWRDLQKMVCLTLCMQILGETTLSTDYYRMLSLDTDEILPENLSDVYSGIPIYDDENVQDLDHPSLFDIAIGIDHYETEDHLKCLHMALEIFKQIHPGLLVTVENPRIYERLIKILRYGRAASRKNRSRRNEVIFRDCTVELEEMRDTILNIPSLCESDECSSDSE